jgi:hypothetical protein
VPRHPGFPVSWRVKALSIASSGVSAELVDDDARAAYAAIPWNSRFLARIG